MFITLTGFNRVYFSYVWLRTPKYAVAVRHQARVCDINEEYQKQIVGYPNATFQKFGIELEAAAFIISQCSLLKTPADKTSITMERLVERVIALEKKFDLFMTETSSKLDLIAAKVNSLQPNMPAFDEADKIKSEIACNENDLFMDDPFLEGPVNKKPRTEDDFITDEKGTVMVYTDGACTNNGKLGAKAGIGVWFNNNHRLNLSVPVQGPPTNNTAEIQAATLAILQAKKVGINKLVLHTDSQFLINCITKWIHKWKKNNWTLAAGGSVKNKEELIKLDNVLKSMQTVEWKYVAGHSGIQGNEKADELARKGALKY